MANAKFDGHTYVPFEQFVIAQDTTYDPPLCGFYTGAAGDVSIVDGKGTTTVIPSVPAGKTWQGTIQKINSSGTTVASPTANIIGLRH